MRYKLHGPSGLRVAEVALGTMTFGDTIPWGARPASTADTHMGSFVGRLSRSRRAETFCWVVR